MSFLKRISRLFSSSGASEDVYWIAARCSRCGETIQARVNLRNDLSLDYGDDGSIVYICRKTMLGEGRCFQRIEVKLTFDENRSLVDREISGGQFVDEN